MKIFIYISVALIALSIISIERGSADTKSDLSLYEVSSNLLQTDAILKSLTGITVVNMTEDALMPFVKSEWENEINKKFTPKEIQYLKQVFQSELFKRYFKVQQDFRLQDNIKKILQKKIDSGELVVKKQDPIKK